MKFMLYLSVVTYICLHGVQCRSVQLDSDVHSVLMDGEDEDGNHDPESNGRFSWKRLKPILRREVQRIRNVIGEIGETIDESIESTSSPFSNEEDRNILDINVNIDENEDSLKTNSPATDSGSMESESTNHNQNEEPNSHPSMPEDIASNKLDHENHQLDNLPVEIDAPDDFITDILNRSSDSILLQALNNNSSEISSFGFDETSLLSKGGHVATIQEVSTVGFELLVDSETKQNSILAEIINSRSNLFDYDEFENSTDENGLHFATTAFIHSNGSELQDVATESELMGNNDGVELDVDEAGASVSKFHENAGAENTEFHINRKIGTEISEFHTDDEAETEITEFHTDDEAETEITEFHTDNEAGTEITEFRTDNEAGDEDTDFDKDEIETKKINFGNDEIEITQISTDETKDVINNGSELSTSILKDVSVTENRSTETEGPKCPDPGWCIFWFFALDTCAKDSHCHGSLLCCMIGCSKTCIDPEFS